MLRRLFIYICVLLPAIHCCGQQPVQWKVSAQRHGDTNYIFIVSGTIQKGWHLYAVKDTSLGLEPLRIEWNNESIVAMHFNEQTPTILYKDPLFENKKVRVIASDSFHFSQPVVIRGKIPSVLPVTLKVFASDNTEFLPVEETKQLQLEGGVTNVSDPIKLNTVNLLEPSSSCGEQVINQQSSLLSIFIKGFGGGLIALLMPCLFPMIPVTVSFFNNKSKDKGEAIRHASLYGLSIVSIYLLASLPFHLLRGIDSQIFNTIATNAWVNLCFFLVFVLFALSLFGIFELRLPAFFSNQAGTRSGIFFMALTLAIVSFSCTGPILGTLLVGSLADNGNAWQLTAGMFGFGLALALPFTLFAIFPQWLRSLPKSGGWMDVLKKVLAFIELALAIKFLSNADLVEHWGILKREIFIACWVLIAALLACYLFGFFDKKQSSFYVAKDGMRKRSSLLRISFGILFFLFAIYMTPGLLPSGKSKLKLLSGFPPPSSYSIYSTINEDGVHAVVVNDFDKALELAKKENKPLLIDFTGWACVNCRKMEELVWTKPDIKELIEKKFILVSLYVDDRKKLLPSQQFSYGDKEINTVGDKWATFQSVNFGGVSQPMYVVLSPDEKLMNHPVGYTEAGEYGKWLECGLHAFANEQQVAKR